MATVRERAGDGDKRDGSAPPQKLSRSQRPKRSPESLPAAKAMKVETMGPRPGADSEGIQDMTRKLTEIRPQRAARMQKLCVTWI